MCTIETKLFRNEAVHDCSVRPRAADRVDDLEKSAAAACDEGGNGFAGKVICFQEKVERHRHIPPRQVWIPEINDIIAVSVKRTQKAFARYLSRQRLLWRSMLRHQTLILIFAVLYEVAGVDFTAVVL